MFSRRMVLKGTVSTALAPVAAPLKLISGRVISPCCVPKFLGSTAEEWVRDRHWDDADFFEDALTALKPWAILYLLSEEGTEFAPGFIAQWVSGGTDFPRDLLRKLLHSENWEHREFALKVLQACDTYQDKRRPIIDKHILKEFVRYGLQDRQLDVQFSAIDLSIRTRIYCKRALDKQMLLLQHPDSEVRERTARNVANLWQKGLAAKKLIRFAIRSPDPTVMLEIAQVRPDYSWRISEVRSRLELAMKIGSSDQMVTAFGIALRLAEGIPAILQALDCGNERSESALIEAIDYFLPHRSVCSTMAYLDPLICYLAVSPKNPLRKAAASLKWRAVGMKAAAAYRRNPSESEGLTPKTVAKLVDSLRTADPGQTVTVFERLFQHAGTVNAALQQFTSPVVHIRHELIQAIRHFRKPHREVDRVLMLALDDAQQTIRYRAAKVIISRIQRRLFSRTVEFASVMQRWAQSDDLAFSSISREFREVAQ